MSRRREPLRERRATHRSARPRIPARLASRAARPAGASAASPIAPSHVGIRRRQGETRLHDRRHWSVPVPLRRAQETEECRNEIAVARLRRPECRPAATRGPSAPALSENRASAPPVRSRRARPRRARRTPRARRSLRRPPACRQHVRPVLPDRGRPRRQFGKAESVMPNVAPACRAMARARSSAAPREAPTMISSEAGGRWARKRRAASSRAEADVEVMMRTQRSFRTPCRTLREPLGSASRKSEVRS